MPITAHIKQLQQVSNLCEGLEWVAACPDQAARDALLHLIGEEVGATIKSVLYAVEAKAVGRCPAGDRATA